MSILEKPFLYEDHSEPEEEKRKVEAFEAFMPIQNIREIINNPQLKKRFRGDEKSIFNSLHEDFDNLVSSLAEYIQSADTHEFYAQKIKGDINEENIHKLQSFDSNRHATHNILVFNVNLLASKLKMLGIDNNLIYAINGGEDELNSENERDRRAVEHWARLAGKYLSKLSNS